MVDKEFLIGFSSREFSELSAVIFERKPSLVSKKIKLSDIGTIGNIVSHINLLRSNSSEVFFSSFFCE